MSRTDSADSALTGIPGCDSRSLARICSQVYVESSSFFTLFSDALETALLMQAAADKGGKSGNTHELGASLRVRL